MKTTIYTEGVPLSSRRGVRGEVNRLDKVFTNGNKNLLNIFCTAGYPYKDSTTEVILALQKHGADMIEIGMPYSDPVADGPVIQKSNMVALQNGMTLPLLFEQLRSVKEQVHVPIILMGYLNPVLQYGMEKFCADAAGAGVDAVILPDLPMYEFETAYKNIFQQYNLHIVFLITPETGKERIQKADKLSNGFLYAVSSSATTGETTVTGAKENYFKKLAQLKITNPVMIGFGISNNHAFAEACKYASGAIIGSAYINALDKSKTIDSATEAFIKLIRGK